MRKADDFCCDWRIQGYTKNTYLISGEKSQLQAKPATCNKYIDRGDKSANLNQEYLSTESWTEPKEVLKSSIKCFK